MLLVEQEMRSSPDGRLFARASSGELRERQHHHQRDGGYDDATSAMCSVPVSSSSTVGNLAIAKKQQRASEKALAIAASTSASGAGPSTRLSGLMKRIQAKASDCQNQLESFVSNVSSAVHGVGASRRAAAVAGKHQGVVIGPVPSTGTLPSPSSQQLRQYIYPGNSHDDLCDQLPQHQVQPLSHADEADASTVPKKSYVIKLATLTPATLHSAQRQSGRHNQWPPDVGPGSCKTWNAPLNGKLRPDLSSVGFRPDKHVTCIEVTLVNNRTQTATGSKTVTPKTTPPTTPPVTDQIPSLIANSTKAGNGIRTYCFGELPSADEKSPSGTVSSRSSSRGSDQFDSGFEELGHKHHHREKKSTTATSVLPAAPSVIRSIFDKLTGVGGGNDRKPRVQAKKSTIRREKAFRQRNKHAWSRAKELQRNDELQQRFHQIRKRLGEEEDIDDVGHGDDEPRGALPIAAAEGDLLCPLPSIVQTLVRQYDSTGQEKPLRSREKITPSRLHSRRQSGAGTTPTRPPRTISSLAIVSNQVRLCTNNAESETTVRSIVLSQCGSVI